MYKIFVNNLPIYLTDKQYATEYCKKNNFFETRLLLILYEPGMDLIRCIEIAENGSSVDLIIIASDDIITLQIKRIL